MCCPCDPEYDRLERENFEHELFRRDQVIGHLEAKVAHLEGVIANKPGNALTEAYARAIAHDKEPPDA